MPPKPPEPAETPEPASQPTQPTKPTATEEMAEMRAGLDEAKNEAILRPTPASVSRYLALQSQTMDKAMLFTDMWQRVRWSDPTLDYTFQHPTAAGGVRVDRQMTRDEEKAVVTAVAKENGIFFFFKANCPYCNEQGRILQALMDEYKMEVVAVSLDGSHNPYFPDAKPDNGIAAKMGVQDAPAMFVVNPDTGDAMPLGYGVIPIDEVESRIRRLVSMKPGEY
jgi:conjugal transfer pilus assembly protein TraF